MQSAREIEGFVEADLPGHWQTGSELPSRREVEASQLQIRQHIDLMTPVVRRMIPLFLFPTPGGELCLGNLVLRPSVAVPREESHPEYFATATGGFAYDRCPDDVVEKKKRPITGEGEKGFSDACKQVLERQLSL